ncbi:hypothetical protein [Nitrosomonas sp. wSCUT-2]
MTIHQEPSNRPLKNVFEAADTKQKQAKKRSLYGINEHFELVFNTVAATQIVFQRIWTPPVLQAKFVMILRCNCFRISGFLLDSFTIRAMMDFARKIQIGLAALPCHASGREPVEKTELLTPV